MMLDKKYEEYLKIILGRDKYIKMYNYTLKRIVEIFGEQEVDITQKIMYINHSAVLIIGILKSRNSDKKKIISSLHVNDLLSIDYFIEKDIDKFIEVYSEYIKIIENYDYKKRRRYKWMMNL